MEAREAFEIIGAGIAQAERERNDAAWRAAIEVTGLTPQGKAGDVELFYGRFGDVEVRVEHRVTAITQVRVDIIREGETEDWRSGAY